MSDVDPNAPPPPVDLAGLDPGELLARGLHTVRPSVGATAWEPPTPEELGRLLPQYRIESLLGRGGMGAVYKGIQLNLDRPVAIKLLPAEMAVDREFVARFEREARTLAKLQHSRIVTIFDVGQTTGGHLYFVMEYIDGTDLRRILKGPGLDPEQALAVVGQLCDALQAAHREGIVHRDIKPENVLINRDGYVKLADFGLSRPLQEDGTSALTNTNVVMGTYDYMAPEQHSGASKADHRSDIFALGVMFYEMLTGQPPRGVFDPPSRKVQVDVRIDEVVLKALQSEPDRRYQQASELKTDVDRIRSTPLPVATTPEPPPTAVSPRKRSNALLPIAAVCLVLLGLAAYFVWPKSGQPSSEGGANTAGTKLAQPENGVESVSSTVVAGGAKPAHTATALGIPPTPITPNPTPRPATGTATPASATPQATTAAMPFTNTLGMKFVPVPGTNVLFSVWDTRVQDYAVFEQETGRARKELKPKYEPGPTYPVVWVSWEDAEAFCSWLGKKEGRTYRLPRDAEWSAAVGPQKYPWGDAWPPTQGAGNYNPSLGVDTFNVTSPVGTFAANRYGLYDMGGNVWQWCEDEYRASMNDAETLQATPGSEVEKAPNGAPYRVTRGGAYGVGEEIRMRSSFHGASPPASRLYHFGFRCVLEMPAEYRAQSLSPPRKESAKLETPSPLVPPPVPPSTTTGTRAPEGVTKGAPIVNSLGMKFVPVPGTQVLFSIWDTRVQDYQAFVQETGWDWPKPNFTQGPTHPAVFVSWQHARAFCDWLSRKEAKTYRLPSDAEWSAAAGPDKYPWGPAWPPASNTGNYDASIGVDSFEKTSPVGSFAPNRFGLYDISGNVWQWCEDPYRANMNVADVLLTNAFLKVESQFGTPYRVLRGGSWRAREEIYLRCSSHYGDLPWNRTDNFGFRVVLDPAAALPPSPSPNLASQPAAPVISPAKAPAPPAPHHGIQPLDTAQIKPVVDVLFSHGLSGFDKADDSHWKLALVDGEYQMVCRAAGLWCPGEPPIQDLCVNDCIYEVQARMVNAQEGGWGLGFIYGSGADQGWWTNVSINSRNQITSNLDRGEQRPWQSCPAIQSGRMNTLRVEALGSRARVFVNGVFVFERPHERQKPDSSLWLYCFGDHPPVEIRVHSVKVWKPPAGTHFEGAAPPSEPSHSNGPPLAAHPSQTDNSVVSPAEPPASPAPPPGIQPLDTAPSKPVVDKVAHSDQVARDINWIILSEALSDPYYFGSLHSDILCYTAQTRLPAIRDKGTLDQSAVAKFALNTLGAAAAAALQRAQSGFSETGQSERMLKMFATGLEMEEREVHWSNGAVTHDSRPNITTEAFLGYFLGTANSMKADIEARQEMDKQRFKLEDLWLKSVKPVMEKRCVPTTQGISIHVDVGKHTGQTSGEVWLAFTNVSGKPLNNLAIHAVNNLSTWSTYQPVWFIPSLPEGRTVFTEAQPIAMEWKREPAPGVTPSPPDRRLEIEFLCDEGHIGLTRIDVPESLDVRNALVDALIRTGARFSTAKGGLFELTSVTGEGRSKSIQATLADKDDGSAPVPLAGQWEEDFSKPNHSPGRADISLKESSPDGPRPLAYMFTWMDGVFTLTRRPFGSAMVLTPISPPPVTPKFATAAEAQKVAIERYPDLGVSGSKLNAEFVSRVELYRKQRPEYFRDPSWPIRLAEEITHSN